MGFCEGIYMVAMDIHRGAYPHGYPWGYEILGDPHPPSPEMVPKATSEASGHERHEHLPFMATL